MEQLREAEVPAVLVDELPDEPEKGLVTVTCGRIVEGFTAGVLVVLTEADLTGNRAATTETRKLASRRRNAVDLVTLRPGDYVVHAQHGIGRFVEMRSAPCRAPPASTSCWSTRRPSAGSLPTASSCPPTPSTR
jgi:transcription-repair coupling factor (superfamily II helicase)